MKLENENRLIVRVYMKNELQNFSYFIVCKDTREALLVDPYDANMCLDVIKKNQWNCKAVLNTHDHWDHIQGNSEVIRQTGADLMANKNSMNVIEGVTRGLEDGETIRVGKQIHLKVMQTPGHTDEHICLLSLDDEPVLVCGDTLFNAGCGNVSSGSVEDMYKTFESKISKLSDATKVLPGHDYIKNNLQFTLSREPGNNEAKELLAECSAQSPETRMITNMSIEKRINTFLRLDVPEIFEELKKDFPALKPEPADIFKHLRLKRNQW